MTTIPISSTFVSIKDFKGQLERLKLSIMSAYTVYKIFQMSLKTFKRIILMSVNLKVTQRSIG